MNAYLISVVISILMSTAFAAALSFEDAPEMNPGLDQIDPGFVSFCTCNTANEPASCTDAMGCEGTKECVAASGCSGTGCGDEKCTDTEYQDCLDECDDDLLHCLRNIDEVGGWGQTEESCNYDASICNVACEDVRDVCDACTGQWGECVKTDKCCGILCDANKKCKSSTGQCVCAATTEACGAKGTGDGIDNDCDGQTDEGCAACTSGQAQSCTVSGCTGMQTCTASGTWAACVKSDKCCGVQCPSNKLCNGATGNCDCKSATEACGDSVDNDCDGQADEGCAQAPQAGNNASAQGGANNTTSGGNATAGSFQPPGGSVQAGNFSGGGQNLMGPAPAGPPLGSQQPGGLDMNMVIILLIVIVFVVGVLIAIKMLMGKKQPPIPPAAQQQ